MTKVEQAIASFRSGYVCSQAILSVYGEALGLPRETALKLAAGFGGGMGVADTCGAVTGAIMVIGLKHGSAEAADSASSSRTQQAVAEFMRRFKARNGSLVCKELLQCDIGTPEGAARAQRDGLYKTRCPLFVRSAAEILTEMV